jgi:hypothetical protein
MPPPEEEESLFVESKPEPEIKFDEKGGSPVYQDDECAAGSFDDGAVVKERACDFDGGCVVLLVRWHNWYWMLTTTYDGPIAMRRLVVIDGSFENEVDDRISIPGDAYGEILGKCRKCSGME